MDKIYIIEDLIDRFINQQLTKPIIIKLLRLYNISKAEFNCHVISKLKKKPTITFKTINKKSEIFSPESSLATEFSKIYKSDTFNTYKMLKRMLTSNELNYKISTYCKYMDICPNNGDVINYINNGLKVFIKKLLSKCEGKLTTKNIKEKMGEAKNVLNIY